jgi:hypothetical protein
MVETLGQARDYGWKVRVRCAYGKREGLKSIRACIAARDLDMDTLLWTRGRDFPLAMLASRLRCPRCGSREVAVMFVPPSGSGLEQAQEGRARGVR